MLAKTDVRPLMRGVVIVKVERPSAPFGLPVAVEVDVTVVAESPVPVAVAVPAPAVATPVALQAKVNQSSEHR